MKTLTVEARSRASARALYNALSAFHPEILGNADEGYEVRVDLKGSDADLLAVLDAIQRFASERRDAAHVELAGRRLHRPSRVRVTGGPRQTGVLAGFNFHRGGRVVRDA